MEKDMKKIFMHASTGYCGMDLNQVVQVPVETTNEELDSWAWQEALQNAESYGYYETAEDSEEEDEDRDEWTTDQIDCYWEPYDEKKHYGLCY
jgi:hypothetical protein